MTSLAALDYASVFVFAVSGSLTASRAQLDILGFMFIAALTAVGGGTVRDLLLDRNPIFWIGNSNYLVVIALAAITVYVAAPLVESRYRWLLWFDAAALAVAVPAGVLAAYNLQQSAVVILLMGVVTGTFGGLLRDVVCNEMPLVLKQGELYVTAAFAGAATGIGALTLGAGVLPSLAVIAGVTFALRAGSLVLGWSLPLYKPRPPRNF